MTNNRYAQMEDFLHHVADEIEKTDKFNFKAFYELMETLFAKNGFREQQESGVDNILIVRLDAIGDFVLTSAFIRELRANCPAAHITLVVSDFVYPLAELCPYVNEVLHFNVSEDLQLRSISEFAIKYLWKRHFTMAFSVEYLSDKKNTLLMTYLSGAFERIGYGFNMNKLYENKPFDSENDMSYLLLNNPLVNPKEIISEVARSLYVLNAIGLQINCTDAELWYSVEDIQTARQLLYIEDHLIHIVFGIGAGSENRKYPINQYVKAFKNIINQKANVRFVVVGGKSEMNDAKILEDTLPKGKVLNLVGKTTLRETAAVIAQMDMYIGNDTGVMHMAAAEHIPVIAIYRQSKDKYSGDAKGYCSEVDMFAPYQTTAIILRPEHALDDCKNAIVYGGCKELTAHCIKQIKPDEIVEAFKIMIYLLKNSHEKSLNRLLITRNFGQIKKLMYTKLP